MGLNETDVFFKINRGEPAVAKCYDKQQPQQCMARSQTALVISAVVLKFVISLQLYA